MDDGSVDADGVVTHPQVVGHVVDDLVVVVLDAVVEAALARIHAHQLLLVEQGLVFWTLWVAAWKDTLNKRAYFLEEDIE